MKKGAWRGLLKREHGSKGPLKGSRSGMEVDPKMRTEGGSGWVLDGRRGGRGGMRGTQSGLCKGHRRGAEEVQKVSMEGAQKGAGGGAQIWGINALQLFGSPPIENTQLWNARSQCTFVIES